MNKDAQKFIACLEDAGQLLEDYPSVNYSGADHILTYKPTEHFNLALFEKWAEFCEPGVLQKPPIRIIQHLSCTGGTLISKCLAGMPNVVLLSEVNPLSQLNLNSNPRFTPTDLTNLARQGRFPLFNELSEKIFKADIDVISEHARILGKYLVIREHSHSDFMVGESPSICSTVRKLLKDSHQVLSVLTVRHPVESYLSLINNGWVHFAPKTFNEYCNRYLRFIKQNKDVPLYRYEDFVNDPQMQMRRICEALELPFNEDFQDVFDLNAMSGDSGRSSNIISKLERREYDENFRAETRQSHHFKKLCELLDYEPL